LLLVGGVWTGGFFLLRQQHAAYEVTGVKLFNGDDYPVQSQIKADLIELCGTQAYYYPTAETWERGDRTGVCFKGLASGQ
jgi:hypothetical protein